VRLVCAKPSGLQEGRAELGKPSAELALGYRRVALSANRTDPPAADGVLGPRIAIVTRRAADVVRNAVTDIRAQQLGAELSKAATERGLGYSWIRPRAHTANPAALLNVGRRGMAIVPVTAADVVRLLGAEPPVKEGNCTQFLEPGPESRLGSYRAKPRAYAADSAPVGHHAVRPGIAVVAVDTADMMLLPDASVFLVKRDRPQLGEPHPERGICSGLVAARADTANPAAEPDVMGPGVAVVADRAADVMPAVSTEPFRLKQFGAEVFQPLAEGSFCCQRFGPAGRHMPMVPRAADISRRLPATIRGQG
jgi:hypothetical protein